MSNAPPPEPPTLFIDRDAWSGKLDAALRAAGIRFERHRDHFADDTPDPDWLRAVGRRGWVVITRDQNIRRKADELKALREAKVVLFALTSGNLSAQETTDILIAAWPKICRRVAATRGPAVFSITRGAGINRLDR